MSFIFPGKKDKIHYTELAPFEEAFSLGVAILCYHKLGQAPAKSIFPSLYVPIRLFLRQMQELNSHKFQTTSLSDWATFGATPQRQFVITFDDGSASVFDLGLEILHRHKFTAIQYLVADQIGGVNAWDLPLGEVPDRLMDEHQVREWLAAGHAIGSHTRTHPRLSKIPRQQAREEISSSKKKLEDLFSRPIDHFCYPYGDLQPWVAELVAEAGYLTAVTLQPGINSVFGGINPLRLHRLGVRKYSLNFRNLASRFLRSLGIGSKLGPQPYPSPISDKKPLAL